MPKRFFGVIGIVAFAALLIACLLPVAATLLLGGLCLLAGIAACFVLTRWRVMTTAVLLAAAVACLSFSLKSLVVQQPLAAWDAQAVTVTAVVTEVTVREDGVSYVAEVQDGALPVGTKLAYYEKNERIRSFGEGIYGNVTLAAADSTYSLSQGIYLYAWPADGTPLQTVDVPPMPWITRFLQDCRAAAGRLLNASQTEEGGVTAGICVGNTEGISAGAEEAFRRAGISHLLVVSGLHLSLLVLGLFALLRRGLRPKTAALATLPVLVFFCFLMGLSPSVVRAGVMVLTLLVGHLFSRRADSFNSLGLSFSLLVLADPFCIYDVGLLLSFGATVGILLFARPLTVYFTARCGLSRADTGIKRLGRNLLSAASVALAAMTFTLPIFVFFFGEVSVFTLPANLLSVWAAEGVLVLGWIGLLLGLIPVVGGLLALPFLWLAERLSAFLLWVAHIFGDIPWAVISARAPYIRWWLLGSVVLLLLGFWLCRKRGLALVAVFSAISLVVGAGTHAVLANGVTTVSVQTASGGYAALVTEDGNACLLVDGSRASWKIARRLMDEGGTYALSAVCVTDRADAAAETAFLKRVNVTSCFTLQDKTAALTDEMREMLWDGMLLESQNGFLRLTLGHTRVLISPSGADAGVLTADWQENHLTLYVGKPPTRCDRLSSLQAVWLCDAAKRRAYTGLLPWGAYPIDTVEEATSAVLSTRGNGDIS